MSDGGEQRVAVADIGGSNARFAIAVRTGSSVTIEEPAIFSTRDCPTFDHAWSEFGSRADVREICELGVSFAGPVQAAPFRLTNGHWILDPSELAASLNLKRVKVVNDLAAIARAIPALPNDSFSQICGLSSDRPPGPLTSVIGLGTGLGLALLLDADTAPTAIACEGGHIGYAPQSDADIRILAWLKARYGRVSAERVVSGNALRDLIEALGGYMNPDHSDVDLWAEAIDGGDEVTIQALGILLANLGSVAGDFVLAQGSQSVVLAGGLMGRLQDKMSSSAFKDCFYAKGRVSDHVAGIPVFLLDNNLAGLIGAALSIPPS